MQHHREDNRVHEHHVVPQEEGQQRLAGRERIHGIQHLDDHQDGQRDRRRGLGHVVGEHVAADLGELGRALVEVGELPEGDLRTLGVVEEPPRVAEDGGCTDVGANHHVA